MSLLGRIQRVLGIESPRRLSGGWSLGLASAAILLAGGVMLAISSRDVVGEDSTDPVTGAIIAQADEDEPPRRPEGPRDGDPPRGPEGDRPPRDAGPPERGPRGDGDRGPHRGPPEGFGGPGGPPPGGELMRDLIHEIRALREEVTRLREEIHALRGGPEREFRGPPHRRGEGRPQDGDFDPGRRGPPRDGERRGPEGRRGPPRGEGDGERPQRPPTDEPRDE